MTETIEGLEAEVGLIFTKPKIVMTKFGERQLRTAPISQEIKDKWWDAWNARKPALKAAGFGCGKNDYNGGGWEVTHWTQTMSSVDREKAAAASRATDAAIEIPIPEGLTLMPFQKAGVAYAMPREGTLIGDEMGLGKTIQAIAVANAMTPAPKKILVVAPASLLANWRNEINKWQTLADMPVHIIRPGLVFTGKPDGWYVINYDIVTRYAAVLTSTAWDLAIYDECHNMKTRTAQRTLTLLGGSKVDKATKKRVAMTGVSARKRLMLTGTPILNRPAELYPLLHNLDPKRWGSWSSFTRRYCAGQFNGQGYDASGDSRLDELNARLRETVLVRRLKAEVLTELPAKRRQVVPLSYDGDDNIVALVKKEKEIYERTETAIAEANAAKQRAEAEGDEGAYKAAVKKLNEVNGIAFAEMALVRHETALAKVPYVIEHLASTTGKILVFAWHQDVVDKICDAVRGEGVVSITGSTPVAKRQGIKDAFQTDPNIRFFVGNIRAAGEGLTLTASSHVVFAELDWTPARISQAEDRAHRIGQTECVLVQHLVLDDSLDARMAKIVVAKQEVIDRALNQKVEGTEKERPEIEVSVVPLVPDEPTAEQQAKDDRRARLDVVAASLTPEQIAAIHAALRTVASYDADNARVLNGVGFSKLDTIFGTELAAQASLRPRQAAAAMKMIRKYRRQYDGHLYQTIFGVEA
jgi:SNF2 family DNA or RNA helicase